MNYTAPKNPTLKKKDHCFTKADLSSIADTALKNIIAYDASFTKDKIQARINTP
jgi:hypothetical protein